MRKLFCFVLVSCTTLVAYGFPDSVRTVVIGDISLEGNKRTDDFVVYENLTFQVGDTVALIELLPLLRENRILLEKTSLFKEVIIKTKPLRHDSLAVQIILTERWYYLLAPTLALGDRNFNVWKSEYHLDLGRLIFGGSAALENLSGRSDQLQVTALFGFNHQYGISYKNPYAFKSVPFGFELGYDFIKARELAYKTENDSLLYLRTDHQFNIRQHKATAGLTWRPGPYMDAGIWAIYRNRTISDTIAAGNPDYLGNGNTSKEWYTIHFEIASDHTDHLIYPLSGTKWKLEVELQDPSKDGLNRLVVRPLITHYWRLSPKVSVGGRLGFQISDGSQQPYFLQQALGYDPLIVRGYEYYVVDGQHYLMVQSEAKWRLLKLRIPGSAIPIKEFREIPFDIYLRPHLDVGRVWDHVYHTGNTKPNTWMIGGGIGIDVVTYYDYVFSLNWSITKSLENGLYLHVNF